MPKVRFRVVVTFLLSVAIAVGRNAEAHLGAGEDVSDLGAGRRIKMDGREGLHPATIQSQGQDPIST